MKQNVRSHTPTVHALLFSLAASSPWYTVTIQEKQLETVHFAKTSVFYEKCSTFKMENCLLFAH